MRLSLQVRYAIQGIFDLAYNGDGSPMQVRAIGARQGIPARYLEQIFQRLRRAKLVTSKRGPGGGYALARPASEISLRDILQAVEGHGERAPRRARPAGDHAPDFVWPWLDRKLGQMLGEITVEELCRRASRAAVRRANAGAHSYVI